MDSEDGLRTRAQSLVARFLEQANTSGTGEGQNLGSYEPSLFDTAFISMLYTRQIEEAPDSSIQEWLRPIYSGAFPYVLAKQQAFGGWDPKDLKAPLDAILNTMAGTLALLHRRNVLSNPSVSQEPGAKSMVLSLSRRTKRAIEHLQECLAVFDPHSFSHQQIHLGWLERLLTMLETENVHFHFPRRSELNQMLALGIEGNRANHSKETGEWQCEGKCLLVRSESGGLSVTVQACSRLIRGIDCSPAATALYLLDNNTENAALLSYLDGATKCCKKEGLAPARFPASLAEILSVTKALFDCGLVEPREFFSSSECWWLFHSSAGTVDMSLCLSVNNLPFNDSESSDRLKRDVVAQAEATTPEYNFNDCAKLLKSFIQYSQMSGVTSLIASLFERITSLWWEGNRPFGMTRTHLHSMMLFVQSYVEILKPDAFDRTKISREVLEVRTPAIVIQMLAILLSSQQANGHWGDRATKSPESTAFAVLTLVTMSQLDFLRGMSLDIKQALERGREALISMDFLGKEARFSGGDRILPDSMTPISDEASEAFVLAALKESLCPQPLGAISLDRASQKALALARFFHSLPNLSSQPLSLIKTAAFESSYYASALRAARPAIFPPTPAKEKDKYFDFIPIMDTIHNNLRGVQVPPAIIWDIGVIAMSIFLVDEYMEGNVGNLAGFELAQLNHGLEEYFAALANRRTDALAETTNGLKGTKRYASGEEKVEAAFIPSGLPTPRVSSALSVLTGWTEQHLSHPSLAHASSTDILNLRNGTKCYLLQHLSQIASNQQLASQRAKNDSASIPFQHASMGYVPWLHAIGSKHIGTPIGLAWILACAGPRIRGPRKDCLQSVKTQVMLWGANSRSGNQSRMFNDYGSVQRDFEERNVNSVDFPEFFDEGKRTGELGEKDAVITVDVEFDLKIRKLTLLEAARYERVRTDDELSELYAELSREGIAGETLASWLRVYYGGADQFADMYLVRDVTNSTK